MFNPSFPGTCPYITSVGATMVKPGAMVTQAQPEMACMDVIYSGGGFSNYFAMPSYQQEAVDYYLKTYPPDYPATMWNSTGMVSCLRKRDACIIDLSRYQSRAFPDISANGAVSICRSLCVFDQV